MYGANTVFQIVLDNLSDRARGHASDANPADGPAAGAVAGPAAGSITGPAGDPIIGTVAGSVGGPVLVPAPRAPPAREQRFSLRRFAWRDTPRPSAQGRRDAPLGRPDATAFVSPADAGRAPG